MEHPFKLTSTDDLGTIRATLMTQEAVEAFERLEFELAGWRLGRIILMNRLCQIDTGILHDGELYIPFGDACKILGE